MATLASRGSKPKFFPAEVPPVSRPRSTGITHVLDRLVPLHATELGYIAPYIDVAKIGWGLPLLLPRDTIRDRLKTYHDFSIEVSTGGTLLEYAVTHDRVPHLMDEARELGFDIVDLERDHRALADPDREAREGRRSP